MNRLSSGELPLVHEEVRERLRQMIGQTWQAGEKLPPIRDLAQELESGHVSTHRAVRELVEEGLLLSRPRHGTYVNPDFTAASQPLASQRVCLLHWGTPDNDILRPACGELNRCLELAGLSCQVQAMTASPATDVRHVAEDSDALVLINPPAHQPLADPGIPLAIITPGQDHQLTMATGYDLVSVDSEQGGFLAGQHLHQMGLTRVVGLGCQRPSADNLDLTSQLRLRGFRQGFTQPGMDPSAITIHGVPGYGPEWGEKAVSWWLRQQPRPPGIFCVSDGLAIGVARGAMARGLVPGQDLQLIGFDRQPLGQKLLAGGLSTISLPAAGLGQIAADLLQRRLQQPGAPVRRVYLACELHHGATTTST